MKEKIIMNCVQIVSSLRIFSERTFLFIVMTGIKSSMTGIKYRPCHPIINGTPIPANLEVQSMYSISIWQNVITK